MNMNPLKSTTKILNAALLATLIVVGGRASAAPYIPGNIVVLQEGDGSAALSTTSAPVFLLEYLPAISGQALPVQTIGIPTSGGNRLTQSSGSASEGFITRSLNTSNVTFVGYDAPVGLAAVPSTVGTNRCVGQVDFNGNFTRIAVSAAPFNGSNIRSSVSDGLNYWMSGAASPTSAEGIWYSAAGGTPLQITSSASPVNTRVTRIFNGNLYYSVAGSISAFSGLPAAPATAAATGITSSSIYDFAINPAGTLAYVCDDSANGSGVGGLQKWTLTGTTWTKKFTFGASANTASNNLTAGCRGLAVDFSGTHPVLYATTADASTKIITITDNSAFTDTSDSADQAVILAVAGTNTAFRGVALAPPSGSASTAPSLTRISPSSTTNVVGGTAVFTLTGGAGYPTASNLWYVIANSTTNLISGASGPVLTLTNLQLTNAAGYFVILTNASGSVTSSVASLTVVLGNPNITGISPANVTANAGQTVAFTLSGGFGLPAASNFWYKIVGSTTNVISGATATTLTLSNVLGGNTANYFAILTNVFGSSTSAVVSLTVLDPAIQIPPSSAQGLVDGTVQFAVTAAGSAPLAYQWYFADASGDALTPVGNGVQADNSVVFGVTSNRLTLTNLQATTVLNNFVVVVTNVYGSVTSSVASLLSVTNTQAMLALWDFDGLQFTNTAANPTAIINPVPLIGVGTAAPVGTCYDPGTSPLSGATDPADVAGVFTPYGFIQPSPNYSWATENYPAVTGTNKANGVQFSVSTVGAKNINVSYDSRVSSTASDFDRLQFTTNGTTWIDYPASSTFSGLYGSGNAGYYTFNYSLVGFPGVENNPNFGIRIVTEFESTATYGIGTTNFWVGTANSYTSGASGNSAAGTVTYDLVAITADAITNNNVPPVLGSLANTNMVDTNTLTLNFTVTPGTTPANLLTFSAQTLDQVAAEPSPSTISPLLSFGGSGTNRTLTISFAGSPIPDANDAGPILVTATDTNGDSSASWFVLTIGSINQPPTNSLTSLTTTNLLVNSVLTIPFAVGSARNPSTNLTYAVTSDNNTVIPAGNLVVGGNTNTGNLTLTVTSATNQVGNAKISITVYDNDPQEPRSTTANLEVMVRPNTNVVLVDYFNYDSSGSLDIVASGLWNHLSGINGQMHFSPGFVLVDTADNTENLQAGLLNRPYQTNSGAVLYASFTVNMSQSQLPVANGSYFAVFNDGSGTTGNYECRVVAATNGAAPGFYRLGVCNFGSTALNSVMFPQDLTPGSNYLVVASLVLTNGSSTLWVNPTNQSAPSVTDTTPAASATNLFNIAAFELRESGSSAGSINVGPLTIGLAFDSVFYPPQANPASCAVTENTTSLLSPLLVDAGSDLSLISVGPDTNGTVTISGTNLTYLPTNNFVGTDTISYTLMDDLGNTNSSTLTVLVTNLPPGVNPVAYTVLENSAANAFNPLTNDVVKTPGGTLSLVSVTPDSHGTATLGGGGQQVLFTPAVNYSGPATLGYTVTDGIGGTNASTITVKVVNLAPLPVNARLSGGDLVLSWTNAAFNLQSSTNVAGPYITIPGATSPYTNLIGANAAGFYRLVH